MGITGTYKWNDKLKRVVKVSSKVPHLPSFVTFKKPYYDIGLDENITSRTHKRKVLDEQGAAEV